MSPASAKPVFVCARGVASKMASQLHVELCLGHRTPPIFEGLNPDFGPMPLFREAIACVLDGELVYFPCIT